MRDAAHHASKQPPVVCDTRCSILDTGCLLLRSSIKHRESSIFGNISEPQRVETKFRPRAHGEDVANDCADAGGCALEWFDRARMIVAFHFESDRPAVADIDNAGVFFA